MIQPAPAHALDKLRSFARLIGGASDRPSAPTDAFSPVPSEVGMTDLRQLAAAARPAPSHHLDINNIRFGIEIEMMGVNRAAAAQQLNKLSSWWMNFKPRAWQMTDDASLGNNGGEAVSPPMKLKNGQGQEAIRQAYRIMHASGGSATQRCGLHVHVDASVLGEKGLANLMQIAMENEALLFRISQNGNAEHRGVRLHHGEMHYYAKPLCPSIYDPFGVLHADKPNEFRNAYYGAIPPGHGTTRPAVPPVNSSRAFRPDRRDSARYFGVNFNSFWYRGTIEFRLFDATDDPEQAIANVEMVLGMVKNAAEGDYAYLQQNPLGNNRADVSREQHDYFMSRMAPYPALRQRLEQTFTQSGGHIVEDAPKRDGDLLQIVGLMKNGYTLQADGKTISSPLEAQDLLRGHRRALFAIKPGSPAPVQINGTQGLATLLDQARQATS